MIYTDFKLRLAIFCCIAACVATIAVPLVSEATYGGRGAEAGIPENSQKETVYIIIPPSGEYASDVTLGPTDSEIPDIDTEPDSPTDIQGDTEGNKQEEFKLTVSVYNTETKKTTEMELDDYIICVVAAEMPYTFNIEALKAQAVAARSYCIYKMLYENNSSAHNGADVCTSYAHCAAFVTKDKLTEKYGSETAAAVVDKISSAVKATSDQIITYDGKPALALFHSRSWQYTESSKNVWGGDLPYLVSVSTPEEDNVTTVSVTTDELKKLFSTDSAKAVSVSFPTSVPTAAQNDSGRADSLYYLGKSIKAKSVRSQLGLRSCDFVVTKTDSGWDFTVHGYGHGVGMSQYGAQAMGTSGKGYAEILLHYYTGVKLSELSSCGYDFK